MSKMRRHTRHPRGPRPDGPATGPEPVNPPDATRRFAEAVASTIDRRRFLRTSAKATFFTVAVATAGGGLSVLSAKPAWANPCGNKNNVPGPGCPTGGAYGFAPCGPSPCCDNPPRSAACRCHDGAGGCKKNDGANCRGLEFPIYGTGCWSCNTQTNLGGGCYRINTTTCCDCGTRNCGDPYARCVSHSISSRTYC